MGAGLMRPRASRALPSLLLIAGLLLAACSRSPAPVLSPTAGPGLFPGGPVAVVDDSGRTVTFARPPQRIVSLSPGNTESLYALGVGDRVIITDRFSDYPPENRPKAKLTTYPKPNAEEMVSLQPDLIVVLVEGDEFIQQMSDRGIPVLKIFPKTFEGALRDLEVLGRVTGTEARAQDVNADMRRRAAAVLAKTKDAPKPRVFYELDASEPTRPFAAGAGSFYGDLVPLAGGKNIFDDLGKTAAQVSTEQIVARDPEIIILADTDLPYNPQTPDMVKARHGWQQITAVRTGRIYPMDGALLSRPGPRLVEGLEQMAKLLHPELFP